MKSDKLLSRLTEVLKGGAPVATACDIEKGVANRIQLYFESDGEAVMDVINKDDLVQNFPEEGMYVLAPGGAEAKASLRKLEMFEGAEDMYFRTDGSKVEADEFGGVPSVGFMEAVEALCSVKLK